MPLGEPEPPEAERVAETARVIRQFDNPEEAARYSNEFNTRRQQRSKRCIEAALAEVPRGARVLDLPCGTGRLLPLLIERGYCYTGADVSPHMVDKASATLARFRNDHPDRSVQAELGVEDIMALSYPDRSFDAVIVNRLFHHYTQAATRIAALKELKRVADGPIVVFFLNTWTVRGLQFHLKHSRDPIKQRTPISLSEFRANGAAAGLQLTRTYQTRGRYNKEWYATFERSPA